MLLTAVRFAEVLSLGIWIGAMVYLTVGVAPVAFSVAPSRQLAGQIVGQSIARLYALGYVCAAVYVLSILAGQRIQPVQPISGRLTGWLLILIAVMTLFVILNQFVVGKRLGELRGQMQQEFGGVDQTPIDHDLRRGFGKLHGVSALLMMGDIATGLVLLFLTVRRYR